MIVLLKDGTIYEPREIKDSWFLSEVNDHGDLTIYRVNEYVLSPKPISHFAAGEWRRVK